MERSRADEKTDTEKVHRAPAGHGGILYSHSGSGIQQHEYWIGLTRETVTLYPSGDENSPNISYKKNDNKYLAYVSGKVTLLKSSSSSKAKLAKSELKNDGKTETILYVKPKKVGTSTLSLKVKSKTYKIKVNVKKYQNPLASVKVGNKTLNMSKLKKTSNYKLSYAQFAGKKQKISVKMQPG